MSLNLELINKAIELEPYSNFLKKVKHQELVLNKPMTIKQKEIVDKILGLNTGEIADQVFISWANAHKTLGINTPIEVPKNMTDLEVNKILMMEYNKKYGIDLDERNT